VVRPGLIPRLPLSTMRVALAVSSAGSP